MGSNSSSTVRLLLLEALPTTEDLRYMLVTGKKSQKPIQLPFKREREAPTFVITFTNPNRWSLNKGDGVGGQTIWTKDSVDVMVIQNKIKTDSAVYSNTIHYEQEPEQGQDVTAVDSLQRIFPGHSQSQNAANQTGSFNAQPPSMPFGDWSNEQIHQRSGGGTATDTNPNLKDGVTSTGEFAPTALFASWIPDDKSSQLPQPVELDQEASAVVYDLLRDPATGLLSFQALTFFLVRELIRSEVSNTKLSVLAFDFVDAETGKAIEFSDEQLLAFLNHMNMACSTLHITSRMDSGEYVLLLCDSGAEEAQAFAEAIRQLFEEDEHLAAICGGTNLTFGIAVAPSTSNDPGILIAAAKQIKDAARTSGNPHLVF